MALPYAPNPFLPPVPDEEMLGIGAPPALPPDLEAELEAQLAAEHAAATGAFVPPEPVAPPMPEPPPAPPVEPQESAFVADDRPVRSDDQLVDGFDVSPYSFEGREPEPPRSLGVDLELEDPIATMGDLPPLPDEEVASAPLADMTDEALAMRAFELKQEQEAERERMVREEAAATEAKKAEHAAVYEQRLADVEAKRMKLLGDAQDLAQKGIDGNRWMDSRSVGQKIAMAFGILAGGQLGIISGRGGNEALEFFQSQINQDIDIQRVNLEKAGRDIDRQQGIVAELYRQTGDAYEAAETARMAAYDAAITQIDNQIAQLNPEGVQAIEKEMLKRKLMADKAQREAAFADTMRKRAIEDAKFDLEKADKLSQIQKRDLEMGKLQAETAKLNRRGDGKKVEEKFAPEYFKALYDKAPPIPMTQHEFENWLGNTKKVRDLGTEGVEDAAKQVELNLKQEELAQKKLGRGVAGVETKGGGEFQARSEPEARDLRAQKAAVDSMTGLLDDVTIGVEKNGHDFFSSPEGKRIRSDYSQAMLAYNKVQKAGALDEGSLKVFDTVLGGDPNKTLRNTIPVLRKLRQNLVETYNNELLAHDTSAKYYNPPRKEAAKNIERSKAEMLSVVAQGVPPGGDKAKALENSMGAAVAAAKRGANLSDAKDIAEQLQGQISDGTWTRTEAAEILHPLAIAALPKLKKNLQKDGGKDVEKWTPAQRERAKLLGDLESLPPSAIRVDTYFELILGESANPEPESNTPRAGNRNVPDSLDLGAFE